MSASYFISDIHLEEARPDITQAFARFLTDLADPGRNCSALYILGDLFERWVGDDDDAPFAQHIRELLARFRATGAALYLMGGNRDFLLGERFCAAVGAQLLREPLVLNLCDTPTLLLHGDSLCTDDVDYQALRLQSQDPAWRTALLARSLRERRAFARELRHMSRAAIASKSENLMDVNTATVAQVASDHGVTAIIHGHTHRPKRHREPWGERWVLGDWQPTGIGLCVSANYWELFSI